MYPVCFFTGGGNPVGPPLTPVQEKLQDVLGPKHPTISGICRDADFEDEYYGEDVTVPAK